MTEAMGLLDTAAAAVRASVVVAITVACCVIVEHAKGIPRYFRRTNKEVEFKSPSYIYIYIIY